jgi:hypothetical protein
LNNKLLANIITTIKTIAFPAILVIFIIYGLVTKLLISLNLDLNSDLTYPGIVSLEIWKHHNVFLTGFYLFSLDSGLLHDIIPFHLIPQIISNYDPNALRLVAYALFVAVILVFSYIIFLLTDSRIKSLLFMALVSNLQPLSYSYYALPSCHIATILFAGIFFLIFFDMIA